MSEREADERAAVVATARLWLRTPYIHAGRVRGAGTDCAMLLAEVYHAAVPDRVPRIEPEFYPFDWALHRDVERYLVWVEAYAARIATPLPGDAVLFKVGRCFSHAGIVTAWPRLIHAVRGPNGGVELGDAERDQGILKNRDGTPRERRFYTLWPNSLENLANERDPNPPLPNRLDDLGLVENLAKKTPELP